MRQWIAAALMSLAAMCGAQVQAFAQDFPNRTITVIVPFAAGGPADITGRIVADILTRHLGGNAVVENVAGAGGTIGAQRAARSTPDGYTLLSGHMGTNAAAPMFYPNLGYDPQKDFEPIGILAISASGIIVNANVPVKDLKEFIAYAKANEAKMSYGSAGAGTMTHLAGELFKHLIKAPKIVHVPYKGAGPSIADLVSGQVQYGTINVTGQLLQLHDAGKVKILAVTSAERLQGAPKFPTAVEAGLPNMVATLFTGLLAPAGTPKPILDQIAQATQKLMKDPEMQKALTDQGLEPITDSTPDKMRAFLQEEEERWTPVLKAAGLKL